MKNNKKILLVCLSLVLLIIIFFLFNNEKKDDSIKIVRVGYFLNITHPQAILGLNRNDFAKELGEKVKIEKKLFNAGPSAVKAFMADELDIGYIGPVPALNAFSKTNGEIIIIAGACNSGTLFVIQNDSNIKSLSDLKGKKIGTPQLGNTQDVILRYLLHKQELVDSLRGGDVEIINISASGIFTLFNQRDIEAALVAEPWGTRLIIEANAKIFMDEKQVYRNGDYPVTVLAVRKKFLQENPEIIKKWLRVHVRLTDEINKNFQETKKNFLAEIEKTSGKKVTLTDEVLDKAFLRIKPETSINYDAMQDFVNVLNINKFVRKSIDINKAIDVNFLNEMKNPAAETAGSLL